MQGYDEAAGTNVPQDEKIPGKDMEENRAGGYTFTHDLWSRLNRFLVLGADSATYYADRRTNLMDNAEVVHEAVDENGERVVREVVDISDSGRAPNNDPALFSLAVASVEGDEETRREAYHHLSDVARIPTHLFNFLNYRKALGGGWGRGMRNAVNSWYNRYDDPGYLAYHLMKYRQRNGWTHRDALLLSHAVPKNDAFDALFEWAVYDGKGEYGKRTNVASNPDVPEKVVGFEQLHAAQSAEEVANLLREYNLTHDMVPSEFKNSEAVWEAVLEDGMPLWALFRNLGKLTEVGVLGPATDMAHKVAERLTDESHIHEARVHPMKVLQALSAYESGGGPRGSLNWTPVQTIVDALDEAFYAAFDNVEPTGQRIIAAADTSGSMTNAQAQGLTGVRVVEAALAQMLVTMNVEDYVIPLGFDREGGRWGNNRGVFPLEVSESQSLGDALDAVDFNGGGTDVALPIKWAVRNDEEVDAFVLFSDNQTWAGGVHPSEAIKAYRKEFNTDAKMVTVDMQPNRSRVGDPDDTGTMHVSGFDTTAPQLINQFLRGEL